MDWSALILLMTSILLPVVKLLGLDPMRFGMIMMVTYSPALSLWLPRAMGL